MCSQYAAVEPECSIVDETIRPSPMKMRTRSKARRSLVIPDADICSDVEDDEPRPRQRKCNTANAIMPRAVGTSKFFRRNSNQFTCVASKTLAARKTRAGPKNRKRPSSRMRVRGGRLEPDDDIEFFHFKSLIFPPSLLRMQLSTEPSPDCVQGSLS